MFGSNVMKPFFKNLYLQSGLNLPTGRSCCTLPNKFKSAVSVRAVAAMCSCSLHKLGHVQVESWKPRSRSRVVGKFHSGATVHNNSNKKICEITATECQNFNEQIFLYHRWKLRP